jgi:hypothetical protein
VEKIHPGMGVLTNQEEGGLATNVRYPFFLLMMRELTIDKE